MLQSGKIHDVECNIPDWGKEGRGEREGCNEESLEGREEAEKDPQVEIQEGDKVRRSEGEQEVQRNVWKEG